MENEIKRPLHYPFIYSVLALLLWLLPFFWTGWTGRSVSLFPKGLSFQHSAAGLFTQRSTHWWDHHVEMQAEDDGRYELDERSLFPMGAFGYRTRYDRILNESNRSRMSGSIRLRLAEHVGARMALGKGLSPKDAEEPDGVGAAEQRGVAAVVLAGDRMKALRLVRMVWPVGCTELAAPEGCWNPPPVTAAVGAQRLVLGTYKLVGGR